MYRFVTEIGNTWEVRDGRLAILDIDGEKPYWGTTGFLPVRWITPPAPGCVAEYHFPGDTHVNRLDVWKVLDGPTSDCH